ncbi:MAG: bifunctional phosphoribosyl-AMP cyclohydrolase/phosphoribosyl-ATP diphosphatase HisIE [Saprospiraceae bacterium]|nr:bifunctional phosphoribosyl-AMP cyclohydrolase/phosphoribosyl-ATP diphosphatase HisIE [Saprospiraceae bacterium]
MKLQTTDKIDFDKSQGLVPAIVQHAKSGLVLMLGYMNEEAVQKTLDTNKVTFFSRSKNRLWTKGETSGHFLNLHDIRLDCDADALLVQAIPIGPTCHTGTSSCFGEEKFGLSFMDHLEETIRDRHQNPSRGSYTSSLFEKGLDKIAQKVGEEAVETVIEAKNQDQERFLGETADLLYHLLVLLRAKNVGLQDVLGVLKSRHQ